MHCRAVTAGAPVQVLANLLPGYSSLAAQLGVEATIELIRDRTVYARYGLLATPGLVVDEKLVSGGRVPSVGEITTLFANTLAAAK